MDRRDADRLVAVGLGLAKPELRLERTRSTWVEGGGRLRESVADRLGQSAVAVAHIGSSSVETLLAKPIVDLAVGLGPGRPLEPVRRQLEADGWIHRGDAGDDGGHVFVLEAGEQFRVAHLHVVDHEGAQWRNYLRLREVLRSDPRARRRYEEVKERLVADVGPDRVAYTDGKTEVIRALLAGT